MRFFILMMCILGFMFFGCAGHTYDPNKDYSFNANPGEIVQNPKPNESRIYIYRPSMTGVLVSYDITLHTVDDIENNFQSGYFVGKSRSGSAFYVDIVPNGESIVLSAKTEARKTFDFVPQPNKIYCVLSGLSMGFFVGRPYFSLVDKKECIKNLQKLLTRESLQQWQKDRENFYKK